MLSRVATATKDTVASAGHRAGRIELPHSGVLGLESGRKSAADRRPATRPRAPVRGRSGRRRCPSMVGGWKNTKAPDRSAIIRSGSIAARKRPPPGTRARRRVPATVKRAHRLAGRLLEAPKVSMSSRSWAKAVAGLEAVADHHVFDGVLDCSRLRAAAGRCEGSVNPLRFPEVVASRRPARVSPKGAGSARSFSRWLERRRAPFRQRGPVGAGQRRGEAQPGERRRVGSPGAPRRSRRPPRGGGPGTGASA